MAQRFLARVANALLSIDTPLARLTVVVPNRRAGIFLMEEIRTAADKPLLAPELLTWSEFLARQSPLLVPDALTQVLTLYKAWQEAFPAEPLEEFFPWGEVLLTDFDAVDRQLVDANQLFQNLADIDTLEAQYPLEIADMPRLQAFWQSLTGGDGSEIGKQFLHVWQKLGALYQTFHASLEAQGYTTEARIARNLAERIQTSGVVGQLHTEDLAFVGFTALAKAEEVLLLACMRHLKSPLFIDGDAWYVDKPRHQAGYHLRQRMAKAPNKQALEVQLTQAFKTQPRTIETHRCPTRISEALALAEALAALEPATAGIRTAVVLPDETLLPHVLQRLPEGLSVNITMGYPLVQSQVYRFIHGLLELWLSGDWAEYGSLRALYVRPLLDWLGLGLTHRLLGTTATTLREQLHASGWQFVPITELTTWAEVPHWFVPPAYAGAADTGAEAQHLQGLLQTLEASGELPVLESEAALLCWQHAQRLADGLSQAGIALPRSGFWRLVRRSLSNVRIPFIGEPLAGVQIMGFLETRLLDFERLFILSANEGVLPPAPPAHSFIPYGLRKAYGLPTREDTQAVNAYHFYRLLQRCETAQLFYSTEGDQGPSRYLLQLELEAAHETQTTYREIHRTAGLSLHASAEISIPKNGDVLDVLAAYHWPTAHPNPRTLSPTALGTYLRCPLRFYYRYVAGLKEPDDTTEELDAGLFGDLLHHALQLAYEPLVNQRLTPEALQAIANDTPAILQQATKKLPPGISLSRGQNRLRLGVIERLFRQQVQADIALVRKNDIELLGVEQELEAELPLPDGTRTVLAGKLDRVERMGSTVRILDYKTGRVDLTPPKSGDHLDQLFTKQTRRAELQTLLYGWLYLKTYPVPRELQAGVLPFRTHSKGPVFSSYNLLNKDNHSAFEKRLQTELAVLFGSTTAFVQVKERSCEHCPYYRLCYLS